MNDLHLIGLVVMVPKRSPRCRNVSTPIPPANANLEMIHGSIFEDCPVPIASHESLDRAVA